MDCVWTARRLATTGGLRPDGSRTGNQRRTASVLREGAKEEAGMSGLRAFWKPGADCVWIAWGLATKGRLRLDWAGA